MRYQYEAIHFASNPRFHQTAARGAFDVPNFDHAKRQAKWLLQSLLGETADPHGPDGIRLFDKRGIEVWCWCGGHH